MTYRCPWNRDLKCPYSRHQRKSCCPIIDSPFLDAVFIWALTGRTPRSVSFDAVKGTNNFDDYREAKKADIYRLFNNGSAVLDVIQDRILMSISVCTDMAQAREKWKDIRWRERYGQEKSGASATPPTVF